MIKDTLSNLEKYTNLPQKIKTGLKWLFENNLKEIELGKYLIDGEDIYVNVQEYTTKTDAKYEAHKEYIDIQYVIEGAELVGVTDIKNCTTVIPYDKDKDIEFLNINTDDKYEELSGEKFLILYPDDAHKPSMSIDNKPDCVKKAVVKVRL